MYVVNVLVTSDGYDGDITDVRTHGVFKLKKEATDFIDTYSMKKDEVGILYTRVKSPDI